MLAAPSNPLTHLNDAARGLSQQMVWWGNDVNHPEGNALVRYGLERTPSLGLKGTSCYSAAWHSGVIDLHGAVVSWRPQGGGVGCIFSRDLHRIDLWQADCAPVPGHDRGEAGEAAIRWSAAQSLLGWVVAYEKWVLETLGSAWRVGCWRTLKRLPMGKPWLPPDLALNWWQLAVLGNPPRPKTLLKN